MKKYLITLIVFSLIASVSCKDKVDIEKEAVIAANEEERDAFMARDLSRLEAIWIQEPSSRRVFTSSSGPSVLDGWNEIYSNYEGDINNKEMWESSGNVFASFFNYDIQVYGNTALAYHDMQWSGKIEGEEIGWRGKRIVHFVKADGAWKINLIVQMFVTENDKVEELP